VGTLAATVLFAPRLGVNMTLVIVAMVAAILALGPGRRDLWHRCLIGLVVALGVVPALWESPWLMFLCLLGAFGLSAFVVLDGRTWVSVPLVLPALGISGIRALIWLPTLLRRARVPGSLGSWLRGIGIGLLVAVPVGALLASADEGFARIIGLVVPEIDLGELPARAVVLVMVAALVVAAGFAYVAPPRWEAVPTRARRRASREWGVPLALVDLLVLAFLLVQATMLFGGDDVVVEGTGVTYAERAREGFGQLVVVTMITLGLLAWAGRSCDPQRPTERRILAVLGGAMVVGTLLIVVSALRRMWLYEQAYGFTVLRVNVAAFEMWLAVAVLAVAAAWWATVARILPRLMVTWGAVGLLVLALVSPEALVARANVDRFERTGKLDVQYLAGLSADAVPALQSLPPDVRTCALALYWGHTTGTAGEVEPDPWYAANLSRIRADAVFDDVTGTGTGAALPSGDVACAGVTGRLSGR
jgi:hypothetical protein